MTITISGMSPVKVGAGTVLAVSNLSFSPGVNVSNFRHSGNEFPSVGVVPSAVPKVTFKTPFQGAYSAIGMKLTTTTAFEVYFATFGSGLKLGATSHSKYALNASCLACMYITGASVAQNGIFMADVEALLLSNDGRAHPFAAIAGGQTLPTLASEPQMHTLGPFSLNGARIDGATNIGFQQNLSIVSPLNDGDSYPRTVAFMGADPAITVEHEDPIAMMTNLGLNGTNVTTSAAVYARGVDPTTQLMQTTGVSITAVSGRDVPMGVTFDLNRNARMQMSLRTLAATAAGPQTHPLAVALAQTLP